VDLLRAVVDAAHGLHHLGHDCAALRCHRAGLLRHAVGLQGVVGVLLHPGVELFHGGGGLLQRAGLAFGARRQVLVAGGDLAAGQLHLAGRAAHRGHGPGHARQQGLQQLRARRPHEHLLGGGQGHAMLAVYRGHQLLELQALAHHAARGHGQHHLQRGLDHDVRGVQQDDGEIRPAQAVQAEARRLQPVEEHVVQGDDHGGEDDGAPVQIDQQQGQRDEHAEVVFHPALGQLDVQRHEAHLHEGQDQARRQRAARCGMHAQRQRQQHGGGRPRQAGFDEARAQRHRRDAAEHDGGQHDAVAQQGLGAQVGGRRGAGSGGRGRQGSHRIRNPGHRVGKPSDCCLQRSPWIWQAAEIDMG